MSTYIDPRAYVEDGAELGDDVKVWPFAHVRAGARIGPGTVIGSHAFVDRGVPVGARCKIENGAMLFAPAILDDEVFVGPGAILCNDRHPRAAEPDGSPRQWKAQGVVVRRGASIGAGAVVVPPCEIGEYALVAAGQAVTRDVWSGEVGGVPGRLLVCRCGRKVWPTNANRDATCSFCGRGP